ncbi:hypothetical protein CJ030_MR3G009839 [Morella rubra]|uniref:Calcineurin-like phosphoesterase domain-containing protein n=1 Tax=Morella rubra TaxID=262757 RepID=A0A6A1W545_9ROSI|nr:hypothetical protein CJ030_MR3G009839 [Morella rubra]
MAPTTRFSLCSKVRERKDHSPTTLVLLQPDARLNDKYVKFMGRRLDHYDDLCYIFGNNTASGLYRYAPTQDPATSDEEQRFYDAACGRSARSNLPRAASPFTPGEGSSGSVDSMDNHDEFDFDSNEPYVAKDEGAYNVDEVANPEQEEPYELQGSDGDEEIGSVAGDTTTTSIEDSDNPDQEFGSFPVLTYNENYQVQDLAFGTEKIIMGWVRTILQKLGMLTSVTYPYQPDLSRHAIVVAYLSCGFFVAFDIIRTLDDDESIIWWAMHVCLFGFFYFFLKPLIGKASYSNFNKWYVCWILVAAVYHLPSSQPMGVYIRMYLSVFLTFFASSILSLLVFHTIFDGLRLIFSRKGGKWPDIWTILQLSSFISIACCVFLSHCGERLLEQRNLKDQVCSSWLAWVESGTESNLYFPLFYVWDNYGRMYIIYGQFAEGPSEEIYRVYSLWATFIGLYVANYVAETSSNLLCEEDKENIKQKPDFLPMVPWYSGTSADLYKTVFDLVVSISVFLPRSDQRKSQATNNSSFQEENLAEDGVQQGGFLYEPFSDKKELWFDFMADTGDGGNPTYTVARLLAQPDIRITNQNLTLKRGDLLLIGGDIAYPNPSEFTYEKRLFLPFKYALEEPLSAEQDRMTVNERRKVPRCFIIPGNHDWIDGLQTFMDNICDKSWLGGWRMPQRKSYFALKLPKGWWVFGLDLALAGDIDQYQFKFFSDLATRTVGTNDSVIIMTHQPEWLVEWYENNESNNKVYKLIYDYLKERCKLRIAGDIHHYMHHSVEQEESRSINYPQHLLVNGCGGAYVHPTHVFSGFNESHGVPYKFKEAFPSFSQSRKLAGRNSLNFRKQNWQFDFIGGIIYFVLVFSMFPQCELDHIFQVDSISGFWRSCFITVWNAFIYMLDRSYVSLGGATLLAIALILFAPYKGKGSWKPRVMIGILHVSAHLTAALMLMLVLELGVETLVRHKLLATSGYHSLYRWYQSAESRYFPHANTARARIEEWTFGLYPASIKYLMAVFDVPELMAVTRAKICKDGMGTISRGATIVYYASVFLYFWVLSTPAVSFVFGSYLYICVNWFNLHYDEAFSSLRIADYKAFTRFHIKPNGDLQVFTLGVDTVPEEWEVDPNWLQESRDETLLSHNREFPSKWRAASPYQDPLHTVKIIEQFEIPRGDPPH